MDILYQSFKPYFIWSAPYTEAKEKEIANFKKGFKPCFRWSAPYTKEIIKNPITQKVVSNLVLDGQLLILQKK